MDMCGDQWKDKRMISFMIYNICRLDRDEQANFPTIPKPGAVPIGVVSLLLKFL